MGALATQPAEDRRRDFEPGVAGTERGGGAVRRWRVRAYLLAGDAVATAASLWLVRALLVDGPPAPAALVVATPLALLFLAGAGLHAGTRLGAIERLRLRTIAVAACSAVLLVGPGTTAWSVPAFVALVAGSAFAQQSPSTDTANPPGMTMPATPQVVVPPAPNPLEKEDVSKIAGTGVYGVDDKKIGSVSTVLMKPENKTVDRLVIASGGFLGMGAHHVALPVTDFSWDSAKGAFKIAKSVEDLKSMPEWKSE